MVTSEALYALDIETVCNVDNCKGYGDYQHCEHALSPWHGRITCIGIFSESFIDTTRMVFRSVLDFNNFNRVQDLKFIGHNFKFDYLWLRVHGANILADQWVGCTMLMAYVSTTKIPDSWLEQYELLRHGKHRKGGKHSLKCLAPYFLGVPAFWETEDKDNDEYVLKDVEYTFKLYERLEQELKEKGEFEFYESKLLPWTKMLVEAEERGIQIDLEELSKMEVELTKKAHELKKKLDEQWADAHTKYADILEFECINLYEAKAQKAGKELTSSARYRKLLECKLLKLPKGLDYDSPKQMKWLLKDYLGYDVNSLEGTEGTGREILERLAEEGREDVRVYLEWRRVNKLLTAFIPTYKALQVDGIIHPVFSPSRTSTGRLSSSKPNLQQVPPQLRRLFTPRVGFSFIGYDAAAIEAKLIALYTQDPVLYRIIDRGISLHDHNTKIFFGLDASHDVIKDQYPEERKASKNVGFALFYFAGHNRIRIAFAQKGFHFSDEECRSKLRSFRDEYTVSMQFAKEIVSAMEKGEVIPNLFGRPLKIENKEDCYMQSFNMLIQSGASDLNMQGSYNALQACREAGLDVHLVNTVHDFTCFEVKNEHVEMANEIIKRELTKFDLRTQHGPIPLEVEGGVSQVWE